MPNLRNDIAEAIGIIAPAPMHCVEYKLLESTKGDGYTRHEAFCQVLF